MVNKKDATYRDVFSTPLIASIVHETSQEATSGSSSLSILSMVQSQSIIPPTLISLSVKLNEHNYLPALERLDCFWLI